MHMHVHACACDYVWHTCISTQGRLYCWAGGAEHELIALGAKVDVIFASGAAYVHVITYATQVCRTTSSHSYRDADHEFVTLGTQFGVCEHVIACMCIDLRVSVSLGRAGDADHELITLGAEVGVVGASKVAHCRPP